jgi:hypothetical protein
VSRGMHREYNDATQHVVIVTIYTPNCRQAISHLRPNFRGSVRRYMYLPFNFEKVLVICSRGLCSPKERKLVKGELS